MNTGRELGSLEFYKQTNQVLNVAGMVITSRLDHLFFFLAFQGSHGTCRIDNGSNAQILALQRVQLGVPQVFKRHKHWTWWLRQSLLHESCIWRFLRLMWLRCCTSIWKYPKIRFASETCRLVEWQMISNGKSLVELMAPCSFTWS